MAEIKIEKKKPVWPWILLVLIILAIVAFFVYQNQADDDYDDGTTDMVDDMDNSIYNDTTTYDATTNYDDGTASMTGLMESLRDSTRFGTDSTFTKTAFHNLAKLTVAKARANNVESSSALSDLESYAMTDDTTESRAENTTKMTSDFKDVAEDVVSVIESIANKSGTTMQEEVNELKETSSKISDTTPLDKQQTTLQTFFRQAHDVLHNTNS